MLNTKQLEKDLVGFSKYGIELSNGMVMNFSKLDTVYKEKHKVTLDKWQNIKCFVQVTSKREIKVNNIGFLLKPDIIFRVRN
jgi:hypothetical protein